MYLKFRIADGSILPSLTHIEIKLKMSKYKEMLQMFY